MVEKRSFKLVSVNGKKVDKNGKSDNYYHGTSPSTTAKKVFNNHCRNHKIKGACKKTFTIQDTTQGAKTKGKEYTYQGHRTKLSKPKTIELKNGTEYKIQYETKVNRVKN